MAVPPYQSLLGEAATSLAILVSGTNPDGSTFTLPTVTTQVGPFNPGGNSTANELENSNTAAAGILSVSIPGGANQFTWLAGFEITGTGATSATVVVATISGLITTFSYVIAVPAGITTPITPVTVEFTRPLISSAVATAITLTVPSFGAGNTNVAANIHGFRF